MERYSVAPEYEYRPGNVHDSSLLRQDMSHTHPQHTFSQLKKTKQNNNVDKKWPQGNKVCILSGFYSLGRVLFGITKCTGRNSGETGWECDR